MRSLFLAPYLLAAYVCSAPGAGSAEDYARALSLAVRAGDKVYRANFEVHWLPDHAHCWYRVQTGHAAWEFVLVDTETGEVKRAPEAAALGLLTQTLRTSADTTLRPRPSHGGGEKTVLELINRTDAEAEIFWIDFEGRHRSYGRIKPAESRELSTFAGHVWLLADAGGDTLAVLEAKPERIELVIDGKGRAVPDEERAPSNRSPDGQWEAKFVDGDLTLKNESSGAAMTLKPPEGTGELYRGPISWAPDSRSCVGLAVAPVATRQVSLVESSPKDRVQPRLLTFDYAKPGDSLPKPRPVLIHLGDSTPQPIAPDLFPNPFCPDGKMAIRWSPHGDEFYFDYNQRGHQLYRIIAVNAATGAARTVVEETSHTFIDYTHQTWRQWLDQTGELLWMSERDGWCHLWLYDVAGGAVKQQITKGRWVVREVKKVDEEQRQVWFLASGLRAGEDPYHRHLCRVNFDGAGFVQLTQGEGDHEIDFSPDGRFFVDQWSRADQPPVTELRRSEDGRLICELERADVSALLAAGWTLPERFAAKGRDGSTDIYGVLIKPSNFDPARRYPVLEEVYAGPQGAFAPKTFTRLLRQHALAELGFIVVQADGMGTNYRGRAFHDVAWKNLADAGFPDRVAWIKAAAETRPWMDLDRVGIYGGSAGGQNAMRALLDHHDFYRAAFADCGCHDNRMDKLWWNEQWLGWPVDESYVRSSNVADAARLQGALMLCVGELDHNVDPASTMQVVAALEAANKDFELVVIAGAGHGAAETPYGSRRRMDFFVRQLLQVQPSHP